MMALLLAGLSISLANEARDERFVTRQAQKASEWRKERDRFFKSHERSPLVPKDKANFRGLKYYDFEPTYLFCGPIDRYIFHINNPNYYATFLTNKGTKKRYIRYGKFRFQLAGKDYALDIYKSILSDYLFIPYKDLTNGKETYEGGRYTDAEVLSGCQMVLDFNMAYHPSCAYNERFTCPIPPRENFLPIAIKAGEKNHK
jgi:uncharacterized protein